MHRKVIALIIGSAMAMTSLTAAPAKARDRSETVAIVAGVAALALASAALAKRNNLDNRDRVARDRHEDVAHRDGFRGLARDPHRKRGHDAQRRRIRHGHDDGYRSNRRVNLPNACRVHNGQRTGYSGRCLKRYDYGRAALPSACEVRVGGRHRTIYRDRCLNAYGYY